MDQITSGSWACVSVARARRRLRNAGELLCLIENTNLDCSITAQTARGPARDGTHGHIRIIHVD